MADSKFKVTVGRTCTAVAPTDSATLLAAADTDRRAVIIVNVHATEPVYLGNSDVSTSTGFKLTSGQMFSDGDSTSALYGIVTNSPGAVRVMVVK